MNIMQSRRSGSVILGTSRQSRASVSSSSRGRAASVYSTPTRSTRISTTSSTYGTGKGSSFGNFYSGGYSSGTLGPFSINEKQTMQNLNDRLAVYLEKVRCLEKSNNQLEAQIREFYEKRTRTDSKDLGGYWKTIADLRAQINDASLANARLLLQIDNAKLAADDFKTKYESELAIRRGVEMDIQGLRKELKSLRNQIRGTVTVDVDSNPGIDLTKVLTEMREKYEQMAAKNQKDAEAWYKEEVMRTV
eukprot:g40084.t1